MFSRSIRTQKRTESGELLGELLGCPCAYTGRYILCMFSYHCNKVTEALKGRLDAYCFRWPNQVTRVCGAGFGSEL